jgi:competence protein ComEA
MPMDTSAPWRALETPETGESQHPPDRPKPAGLQLLLAAAFALVVLSLGVVAVALNQQGGQVEVVSSADDPRPSSVAGPQLVVEVAGAVAQPGVYSMPQGSRVGDAIAAAGGYSPDVDPRQVEAKLNLAAKLQDGEVVRVPRRGESSAPGQSAGAGATSGTLDLNTASPEQLDTLPGIGPVTAAKIVASREQQPFKSVDDLVSRKIVSAAALAKFRDRVTVS